MVCDYITGCHGLASVAPASSAGPGQGNPAGKGCAVTTAPATLWDAGQIRTLCFVPEGRGKVLWLPRTGGCERQRVSTRSSKDDHLRSTRFVGRLSPEPSRPSVRRGHEFPSIYSVSRGLSRHAFRACSTSSHRRAHTQAPRPAPDTPGWSAPHTTNPRR